MRWKTDRQLRDVRAAYRNATDAGESTTQAVAEALNVTRSHATNLIAKARREGYLPAVGEPFDTRPACPYLPIG